MQMYIVNMLILQLQHHIYETLEKSIKTSQDTKVYCF